MVVPPPPGGATWLPLPVPVPVPPQRLVADADAGGGSGCVVDMESTVDPETASLVLTFFTSHWMVNHSGLDLSFGQQYVALVAHPAQEPLGHGRVRVHACGVTRRSGRVSVVPECWGRVWRACVPACVR